MLYFIFIICPMMVSMFLILLCIYLFYRFKNKIQEKINNIDKNYNIYAEMFSKDVQNWSNMQKFLKEKTENQSSRISEIEKIVKNWIKTGNKA